MLVRDLLTAAEDYLEVKIMKNGEELFWNEIDGLYDIDEKQVYEIVEKMKKVFEEFENHILENGSVNKPVLFENILNIIN